MITIDNNLQLQKFKHKKVIAMGWDWVEFTCTLPDTLTELPHNTTHFNAQLSNKRSLMFNTVYDLYVNYQGTDLLYCTISINPRATFINQNICQVKIDNNFCYSQTLVDDIKLLLSHYQLTFKNYTRLDSFMDFQKTDYKDGNPQQLLTDLSTRKLKLKYKSIKTYGTSKRFDTVAFGTRKSDTYIVFYNKTKEMELKKWKPHISDFWKSCGFDFLETPVYRLEFSNRKNLNLLYSITDGTCLGHYGEVEFLNMLHQYVLFNYATHFQIAENLPDIQWNRLPKVQPFDVDTTKYIACKPTNKEPSNNYKKAFIKRLTFDAIYYLKSGEHFMFKPIYSHINRLLNNDYLLKWYNINYRHEIEHAKKIYQYEFKSTLF